MTLFVLFLPGLAALAGLFVACTVSEARHRDDEDCGLSILEAPWST